MGFRPMDHLKRLRLTSVRSALLRADPRAIRVIDVAMDWGFGHMGHFAHDYRAMFGEAPRKRSWVDGGSYFAASVNGAV